ncbi:MAG: type III polyketide synthase [Bacteroidota bacterium]|nr:type III polyketide synthase [Bacteroidota bacterium]
MSYINQIATAVPEIEYTQSELLEFMVQSLKPDKDQSRKMQLIYDRSTIKTKYSSLTDFKKESKSKRLYTNFSSNGPLVENRMHVYMQDAPILAAKAIKKLSIDLKSVTHLITVSCTGMAAPGIDILLVKQLELHPEITRTSINFMGCYAAIHAFKQADSICKADSEAIVLVVCVELCSLHYKPGLDIENTAANMLFGDGAAAAIISSKKTDSKSLKISGFYSLIEFSGETDMAWSISSNGFLMHLSAYIPQLIEKGIKNLVTKSLSKSKIAVENITHWAIHPGGRKILECIENEININNNKIKYSYDVLKNYGNMSSPTILFVLEKIWNEIEVDSKNIFCASFGPGLTLETMLLQNV